MDNAIDKIVGGRKLDMATPEEVAGLTSDVIDAANYTAKMTDEMVQLSSALETFEEKHKTYKIVRGKTKAKMQSIMTDL